MSFVPQVLLIFLVITQILDDLVIYWLRRALVRFVVVVVALNLLWRRSESVQGEGMVNYMVCEISARSAGYKGR